GQSSGGLSVSLGRGGLGEGGGGGRPAGAACRDESRRDGDEDEPHRASASARNALARPLPCSFHAAMCAPVSARSSSGLIGSSWPSSEIQASTIACVTSAW